LRMWRMLRTCQGAAENAWADSLERRHENQRNDGRRLSFFESRPPRWPTGSYIVPAGSIVQRSTLPFPPLWPFPPSLRGFGNLAGASQMYPRLGTGAILQLMACFLVHTICWNIRCSGRWPRNRRW
jgi:hypothetical protein